MLEKDFYSSEEIKEIITILFQMRPDDVGPIQTLGLIAAEFHKMCGIQQRENQIVEGLKF